MRDFYFPFVGLENHVGGKLTHRLGVWADHTLRWFDDKSWKIKIDCGEETLAGEVKAVNNDLKIEVHSNDIVYNEKNIFVRMVTVKNIGEGGRSFKFFFHQEFELYESHRGDTAYYDPMEKVIIHYKGRRVFLINARIGKESFDDYSVGLFDIEGKEGTHKDAEDGVLSQNPIEHGRVDSVIGVSLNLNPQEEKVIYYWITVAESIKDAYVLNQYALDRTPEHLMKTTKDFWHAWLNKQNFNFYGLDESIVKLFKKSLLFVRAHADNNGSIIASGDSDMLQYGRDTYGYVWPRDGALSAMALDKVGDFNVAKRFFEFSNEVIKEEGYFMHKYRPDKSLGSSWHPWVRNGKSELPIQEDETALVICALWNHYELTKDLEFIENVYNSLIKRAAEFMMSYIHKETGLPYPSYDLWEEKYGITTFTSAAVYKALNSAASFAKVLGKTESFQKYSDMAGKIKEAILHYFYNEEDGFFYKMINVETGKILPDKTLDMSSIYSIYAFNVLDANDPRVKKSIQKVEEKLVGKTKVGGLPRYENDKYYQTGPDPNPWFITTLWLAQYYVKAAQTEKDLEEVKKWLAWSARYALPSGILSEQVNPYTEEQISAAPLTWSHSEFIITVTQYLEKLEELGVCKACNPLT